jgi:hypothetical protein
MNLPLPIKNFIQLMTNAHQYPLDKLQEAIRQLGLTDDLMVALVEAIAGDNRKINTWIFERTPLKDAPIVWAAPIRSIEQPYAWMVGFHSSQAEYALGLLNNAEAITASDPLLRHTAVPPPLLFVAPLVVSSAKDYRNGADKPDEFAIFQVGYKNSPTEVSDLEQRMIINSTHLSTKRATSLDRLRMVLQEDGPLLPIVEHRLELFGILHSEGHNRGHFVGSWPFEDIIKKNCILYEAVEEFRACLASVLLVEKTDLSEIEKDAFALSVFMTRFFGYGYEAFRLKDHRRETVREITVGLLFFEWLLHDSVLSVIKIDEKPQLQFQFKSLRSSFKKAFEKIDHDEAQLVHDDSEGLRKIAREWYGRAYPNGYYSQNSLSVLNYLCESE